MKKKHGIRDLVSEDKIEASHKKFLDFFEDIDEIKTELIQQSYTLRRTENQDMLGITSQESSNIIKNRIANNTLKYCSKTEKILLDYFPKLQHDVSSKSIDKQIEIKLLGTYDRKDKTYRGEFATFYVYEETDTKRKVMIRALKSSGLNDDLSKIISADRLKNALRIKHRNIVKVLGADLKSNPKFIILEYIDGISLDHLIGYVPFSIPRAVSIIKQLCEALYYLHINGVAHSNIKPDKVIIDTELSPVISFFDIASSTRSNQPNLITVENLLYASPEIIKGQIESSDSKCDQFSLGLLIYELITGQPLFYHKKPNPKESLNIQEIFERRSLFFKKGDFYKESLAALNVDSNLLDIIKRMLSEKSSKRYDDMKELLTDLENIVLEEDINSQIALDSYERCCIANPNFTQDFYNLLFKQSEEIKNIFLKVGKNRNPKQHKMLLIAIELLICSKNRKKMISKIKGSNYHKKLSPHHYELFLDTIIQCVGKDDFLFNLKKGNRIPVKEAWDAIKLRSLKTLSK